jgi:hypothetical protein
MKDFGAVMRGFGATTLEEVFGAEWVKLDADGQRLVLQDFLEASEHYVTPREYRRRIGEGNLASYAAVMKVRERRGWDKYK